MNVITKKSPTTKPATTSGTSYLTMMTSNVANNNNIKRRESSMGEDSVSSKHVFYFSINLNDIYIFMTFNNEKVKS
jgi:hypothetical protein